MNDGDRKAPRYMLGHGKKPAVKNHTQALIARLARRLERHGLDTSIRTVCRLAIDLRYQRPDRLAWRAAGWRGSVLGELAS